MIVVSTMVYALGKELGFEEAEAEFYRQLEDPTIESLPCVRTIHRLRALGLPVGLRLDCNSVSIGMARSRAFHEAHERCAAPGDVWVMVDDDVEADTQTIKHLLEAVRGDEPRICLAPYVLREASVVSVAIAPDAKPRLLDTGGIVWPTKGGGLGLAAVNFAALSRMSIGYAATLTYFDTDGVPRLAVFHELISSDPMPSVQRNGVVLEVAGSWLGEDVSFCKRAADLGIPVEALGTGHVKHAGQTLQLDVVRPPAKA